MAIFGIYSKDWTYNYGAYQCTVNYFDDIMFDKDAFLTEEEVETLTPADSWVTPTRRTTNIPNNRVLPKPTAASFRGRPFFRSRRYCEPLKSVYLPEIFTPNR